jgi:phage baseplate assembly protein W
MAIQDFNTSQTCYDLSIFGGVDINGNIKEVWGADALTNSIRLWLASFQGEVLRNPLVGGYLARLITKPMTPSQADNIKTEIMRGLVNEFIPKLDSIQLNITPNYEQKYWLIELSGWSKEVKSSVSVSDKIKNLV